MLLLRRVLASAVLATRAVAPAAVVIAAPLLVACGGGGKEAKEPKAKVEANASASQVLAEARAAAKAGDTDKAHAKYKEAEKLDLQLAVVDEHVTFLLAHHLPDPAVEVAKAYYDAKPADTKGFLLYANALIGAGDFATAAEVAGEVIGLEESNAAGYEARGRAYVMGGKFPEGIEDLRKASELEPKNATYLVSLGSGLHSAGQTDEAGLILRRAIELEESARALRLLGQVRRAQFETKEAVSWLIRATNADKTDPEAWFQLAVAQNDLGDNLEAENSAQKATALDGSVARYWYAYGEMLRFNKKEEEALAAYKKAAELKPPYPKAPGKIAKVLGDMGKYDEAEVYLTQMVQLDRNNPDLYFNLGKVYGAQKKYKLAVEAVEKYLELAPKEDGLRKEAQEDLKAYKRKAR